MAFGLIGKLLHFHSPTSSTPRLDRVQHEEPLPCEYVYTSIPAAPRAGITRLRYMRQKIWTVPHTLNVWPGNKYSPPGRHSG